VVANQYVAMGIVVAIGVILLSTLYVISIPQIETWKFEPKPEGTVVCRGLDCPFLERTVECGLGMWMKENGELASYYDAKKMTRDLVIRDFSEC